MSKSDFLDVVNDEDEIISRDTRQRIHTLGLLHREVHVWFVTPNNEIIFQHRAKDKDTYPDLLDSTVGGHVDEGMTYDDTAIKEVLEETGMTISKSDIQPLTKIKRSSKDSINGLTNNAWRQYYVYKFAGKIEDLKVEEGKAIGFEAWPIKSLRTLSSSEKSRFIPLLLSDEFLSMYEKMIQF